MKVVGDVKDATVTQSQLARALDVSKQRVNQLIDEGVVIRDEQATNGQVMLFESLQNYFLSRNVNVGDENVNFWKERGLHEKAKRELAELKLAKSRGELYESSTVEQTLSEILTNFRSKLLGLPSKCAPQLDGKNRGDIYQTLTNAVEELLTELAAELESVNFEDETSPDADSVEVNQTDS